jgi:hypothetical protein
VNITACGSGVPASVNVDAGAREFKDTIARKQSEWLKSKGIN